MQLYFSHIDLICQATDDRLWDAYSLSIGSKSASFYDSRLIFPVYSGRQDGKLRVSEQEARFAFAESISSTKYYYSVETPTREGYQLTGSKPISAQTDLTVYSTDRQPILNVEFKAKGVSTSAHNRFSIQKDIQKILREPIDGMWFHIIESIDNSTIPKLFETIAETVSESALEFQSEIQKKCLIFHFCILRQQFSLHKHIEVVPSEIKQIDFNRQFQFSYTVTRSELLEVHNPHGWHVNQQEQRDV